MEDISDYKSLDDTPLSFKEKVSAALLVLTFIGIPLTIGLIGLWEIFGESSTNSWDPFQPVSATITVIVLLGLLLYFYLRNMRF